MHHIVIVYFLDHVISFVAGHGVIGSFFAFSLGQQGDPPQTHQLGESLSKRLVYCTVQHKVGWEIERLHEVRHRPHEFDFIFVDRWHCVFQNELEKFTGRHENEEQQHHGNQCRGDRIESAIRRPFARQLNRELPARVGMGEAGRLGVAGVLNGQLSAELDRTVAFGRAHGLLFVSLQGSHVLPQLFGFSDFDDEDDVEVDERCAGDEVEAHRPRQTANGHDRPREHLPVFDSKHRRVPIALYNSYLFLQKYRNRAQCTQNKDHSDAYASLAERNELASLERVANSHVALSSHDDNQPRAYHDEDGDEASPQPVVEHHVIPRGVHILQRQQSEQQCQQTEHEVGKGESNEAHVGR